MSLSIRSSRESSDKPLSLGIIDEINKGSGELLGTPGATGRVMKVSYNGSDYAVKIVKAAKLPGVRKEAHFHKLLFENPITRPYVTQFVDYIERENESGLQGYLITVYELVMDLYDSIDILKKSYMKFLPEVGAAIFTNLRDALNAFHSEGFLHNDIKPENILLKYDEYHEPTGEVFLIDFDTVCRSPCDNTKIKGTLSYWPKFVRNNMSLRTPYNGPTNNYSLGLVFRMVLDNTEDPSENLANIAEEKYIQPGLNEYTRRLSRKKTVNTVKARKGGKKETRKRKHN